MKQEQNETSVPELGKERGCLFLQLTEGVSLSLCLSLCLSLSLAGPAHPTKALSPGGLLKSSTEHWGSPIPCIVKRNKMQFFNHMPPLGPQTERICVLHMGKFIVPKLPPISSQHNTETKRHA